MGKEIKGLKDDANITADGVYIARIVCEFDAINDNLAALMFFEAIDRADECRLT